MDASYKMNNSAFNVQNVETQEHIGQKMMN